MFPSTHPALQRALAARGYETPTPVQAAVLQPEAEGRDLLVSAQTGSGKTVAYGLAFAPTLMEGAETLPPPGAPLALVVAPTRELAMQVQRELTWLYGQAEARIASCIGGMDGRREGYALQAGAHIVVGTPGRLCDHLRRGRLNLTSLRVLVLDEADEMLDLGFREELEALLAAAPETRRTLLFSATIAKDIAALARQYQRDALRIDTLVRNQPHADIEYRALRVAPGDAEHAVVNVLRYHDGGTAMVFCATRDGVRHLQSSLMERGFTSVALSGELSQEDRTRALQSLRDGRARVCVATDVAARGLDLPDLGLVVHADLPTDRANLLHRSGRTGRAGRKGLCVLIVPLSRQRRAEQLLSQAGITATWDVPPGPDEIRARDAERLLVDPVLTETPSPDDLVLARTLLAGRSAEDIAAALVQMYRARLPAPEDLAPVGPAAPGERGGFGRGARDPRGRALRGEGREPREGRPFREPRAPRDPDAPPAPARERGPMAWFRMNIGRRSKADPKWLVPLICRVGQVTRQEIGAIRIFDAETKFEIRQDAAAAFLDAVQADQSGEVAITEATPPGRRRDDAAPHGRAHEEPTRRPAAPTKRAGSSRRRRPEA